MVDEPSTSEQTPRPRKRWLRWSLAGFAFLCGALLLAIAFIQSPFFQEMVRRRIIAALEQTTGARVELREFAFYPRRLEVYLRGLVIHGREGDQEPPFFSAEEVQASWKILSVWGLRADMARLRLFEPRINLAVYDDSRTNLPPFPLRSRDGSTWLEQALALEIGRLEVLRGQLHWNQQNLPIQFEAQNFHLELQHGLIRRRGQVYAGVVDFQNATIISGTNSPLPFQGHIPFLVSHDRIEFGPDSTLQTPRSRLTASGTLYVSQVPHVYFGGALLELDLQEAASHFGHSGWEGNLTFMRTNVEYDSQGWSLQGDLSMRALSMGIGTLNEVPWSAKALFSIVGPAPADAIELWRADLKELEISTLGGRLTGSASVEGKLSSPAAHLNLMANRLSLPALTKVLSSVLETPLEQLQWAAALSGPVQASFVGPGKNLLLHADWQAEAPKVVPPGFTPLSGILRGSYDGNQRRLQSQDSDLILPQTNLATNGWLTPQDSQMSVSLDTTNFEEIRTLAQFLYKDAAELPLHLGQAQVKGLWSGGVNTPIFEGDFALASFTYEGRPWDRFSGHLRYQSESTAQQTSLWAGRTAGATPATHLAELAINSGKLTRGGTTAEFSARLGLENNAFTPRSPFSIQASLHNADLGEIKHLFSIEVPVQGTVSQASVRFSGTRQEPLGEGTVNLTAGMIYQEPFDHFVAQWALQPEMVLAASQFRLQKGKALLQGNATVHLNTKQYQFSLAGSELPLEDFLFLQTQRFPIHGLAQVKLSGEGTFERPRVQGQIEVRQFGLDHEQNGSISLSIETQNRQAHLQLQATVFQSRWQGSGDVLLENSFPFSASLSLENADLPGMLQAVHRPLETFQGRADGQLMMQGELKIPQQIAVQGTFTRLEGTLGPMTFRNVQPLRFQYRDRVVQLVQVRLAGYRLDLEATGSIRLADDPALDLAAKGEMDLSALELLNPELIGAGQVQLDARLGGTFARPLWRGRLAISEGSIRHGSLPNSLSRMKGTVIFEGNRGVLEAFTAESGGGTIRFDGFVSFGRGNGWQLQLSANAESVRIRYPPGVSTTVNGRLSLTGAPESSLLAGRLVVIRENFSPGFDLLAALLRSREEPATSIQSDFLRNMRLELELVSAADIRLETGPARNLQADVDLRVHGTVENPVLLGRIGIQQGELYFAGKQYNVTRGEISFLNPVRIEPILSLSVEARVQQYDISLDFTGPPDRLSVTYRSDPPLPTNDILALLVAGSSRQIAGETSPTQPVPQIGAESLLSQALSAQIGSRLDRIFGAGRIRVDPQLVGFGQSANATVALEQQIKNNFTILYVTDVTSVRRQIIQGEWAISPRFAITGIRDENGLVGINFQLKLRFR
ncbi:MAG: translocation/assembly module TamB domain-containing protein [Acidobacteria bacterium]|nr:translocation/assembly module TamB domain-containing protein [Acidobacteriota bacterium]